MHAPRLPVHTVPRIPPSPFLPRCLFILFSFVLWLLGRYVCSIQSPRGHPPPLRPPLVISVSFSLSFFLLLPTRPATPHVLRQAFGAKDPPWGPHLVTALLTVLPFAYIGLAARVLTRSNRLGKDDDGVGRAVARGGELIR